MSKIEDYPFPNAIISLLLDLNASQTLPVEKIALISDLLHKYLSLRSQHFYGDENDDDL